MGHLTVTQPADLAQVPLDHRAKRIARPLEFARRGISDSPSTRPVAASVMSCVVERQAQPVAARGDRRLNLAARWLAPPVRLQFRVPGAVLRGAFRNALVVRHRLEPPGGAGQVDEPLRASGLQPATASPPW